MNSASGAFVLDAFALLAFFRDEKAADTVEGLLIACRDGTYKAFLSVVNLGELYYRTAREFGEVRAEEVLNVLGDYAVEVLDLTRAIALSAASLKTVHTVSLADCVAAALAMDLEATLVTGDRDFERFQPRLNVLWLEA